VKKVNLCYSCFLIDENWSKNDENSSYKDLEGNNLK
jgi:hypothetical protein